MSEKQIISFLFYFNVNFIYLIPSGLHTFQINFKQHISAVMDCNITDAYLSLTSEPPVRKIKEEPKVEKEPPDNPVMLPPSDEAQFVHDLTQKVNLINKG